MTWTADIVSEPNANHELCVDLFESGSHRARLRRDKRGELELVCYGDQFTIPVEWLVGIIQRFRADTTGR